MSVHDHRIMCGLKRALPVLMRNFMGSEYFSPAQEYHIIRVV